ncbi:ArgP/LysG family DNA-binding transcriptional regulator [Citricoccus sp. NR2]|uniref:ArgP/LysG family DNA-binding transcriptional regulator n=1 Tax=Citricoccus sp. NR2 TaxID=3004095 RepID=UPI0022DD4011|nr:ArgP/LysG family DNA-binding transcriptional regulator [Citricoccus sp. NR2]WBL20019.1 ArgP/LysG family DNA-binding transcriptional regulator [Citricoccus sp. NR2]
MNTDHLRALAAAVDEGTFDAASALLGVSGSAFSQRIKALERDAGQVLLARTIPVTATPAGEKMLRLARQVIALEDDTRRALGRGTGGRTVLPVAVNADSLATWFVEVLRQAATWDDAVLQLHMEDQEHTHDLLRSGAVVAAITEHPTPVSGCTVTRLGTMDYYPAAATALLNQFRDGNGNPDFGHLPVIDFGTRDGLQRSRLSEHARTIGVPRLDPPRHLVPSSEAYLRAVEAGLGWGMLLTDQIPPSVTEGTHPDLELITALNPSRVTLHWQRWTSGTPALDRLTEAVHLAARHMR